MKYSVTISVLAKTAKVIFTVSQYSKNELVRYCHIPIEKLVVVYEGCDHISRIPSDQGVFKKYCIGDKPYILAVGSNALHKNFSVLDEAAAALPPDEIEIIIAGGDFKGWFNSVPDCNAKGARRLGYVTEMELKALYERATAFVFPSNYEGFGLPPLEAMACGCPVIVSKIASLSEICGDAALYIDPDRPEELKEKIMCITKIPSRQEQKEKGIHQAQKYKWSSTAKETWKHLRAANIF